MGRVVELDPNGSVRTTLNEKASVRLVARPDMQISSGTPVSLANGDAIESVVPATIGADSGWLALAVIEGDLHLAFEYRYSEAQATSLLDLADEYLRAARSGWQLAPRPAIDNLYSAAELTVQAQMLLRAEATRRHWQRAEWLDEQVGLSNAPAGHAAVLDRLRDQRSAARYADGMLTMTSDKIESSLDEVESMITFARDQVADPSQRDTAS